MVSFSWFIPSTLDGTTSGALKSKVLSGKEASDHVRPLYWFDFKLLPFGLLKEEQFSVRIYADKNWTGLLSWVQGVPSPLQYSHLLVHNTLQLECQLKISIIVKTTMKSLLYKSWYTLRTLAQCSQGGKTIFSLFLTFG